MFSLVQSIKDGPLERRLQQLKPGALAHCLVNVHLTQANMGILVDDLYTNQNTYFFEAPASRDETNQFISALRMNLRWETPSAPQRAYAAPRQYLINKLKQRLAAFFRVDQESMFFSSNTSTTTTAAAAAPSL